MSKNPVAKARRDLIRYAVERALQLDEDEGLTDVSRAILEWLLRDTAHLHGWRVLAYWQMVERSYGTVQINNLMADLRDAITAEQERRKAQDKKGSNDDA